MGSELEHKQRPGKGCSKKLKRYFFACELWVKRVGTFGVVLYRNQWLLNFILHLTELHIGISIRYENTLFKKCFFQMLYSQTKFNILQLFF